MDSYGFFAVTSRTNKSLACHKNFWVREELREIGRMNEALLLHTKYGGCLEEKHCMIELQTELATFFMKHNFYLKE